MTRKASLPLHLQKKERGHKLSTVRMTFYCLQREVEERIWQLRLLGWLHRPFRSSARANITLSGKKRRKLLQQIRLAQKEKAAMEVEAPPKPTRTSDLQPKSKKKTKSPQDVDMEDLEDKS